MSGPTPGDRLRDRVAVVAGAGQTPGEGYGNGRAMALLFAAQGAHLVLVDRDRASVEETAAMVGDAGGKAEVVVGDVTEIDTGTEAVEVATGAFGRLDVLVNNVGTNVGDGSVLKVDPDDWDRIMRVNTRSVFAMSRAAIPAMRTGGGGSIVNISSAATRVSLALLAYKMSKAAVEQATLALADGNARHGIRVNAICPGLIETPMGVDDQAAKYGMSRQEWADLRHAKVPLGRKMGTAWDVANAALYLASDESSFVTGAIIPVDGGQSLRVG